MRWVTPERVGINRLAAGWLIRRFIDPEAEFSFVPRGTDAKSVTAGTPFYLPGAQLRDFQSFVDAYKLAEKDPTLSAMGLIVRATDAAHHPVAGRGASLRESLPPDAPPECGGLQAILHGMVLLAQDDLAAITQAGPVFDALHASLKARSK